MRLPSLTLASIALCGLPYVSALNDWSKPCFDGECAYDIPHGQGSSGIFKIFANPSGLTDITPAAGWVILDCDPNAFDQDIRLVCETEHEGSGCQHVFDYHGPSDKIVRLPESCGKGPFARVVSMSVAEDQTLPEHAQSKIVRRNGLAPEVHIMTVDSNFAAADSAKTGEVNFGFVAVTVPGLDLNAAFADAFWDSIGNWVKNAAHTVAHAVEDAAHTVAKAATTAASWAGQKLQDVAETIQNKTSFEIAPKVEGAPISLNADLHFDKTMTKSNVCATIDVNIKSTGSVDVSAGVVIAGSILPPKIKSIAAFGGVNGAVDADVDVHLLMKGGFHFQKPLVSDFGLPGLSLPPLITVGPYVSVTAEAIGHIDLNLQSNIHLNYVFNNLQMWYPSKHDGKDLGNQKGMKNKKSKFKLQAAATLKAQGIVQGIISPTVHLGITAIGGAVSANVFVEADAWVRATVSADAQATAQVKGSHKRAIASTPGYTPPYGLHRREIAAAKAPAKPAPPSVKATGAVGFHGCAWIDLGLEIRGGVTGKIPSLGWDAEAAISIFEHSWQLFEKCWAAGVAIKSSVSKPAITTVELKRKAQSAGECPVGGELPPPIEDELPDKELDPKGH